MELFIVFYLADWSKQIEEISKEINISSSHTGSQEYWNDILCRRYSLNL